MNFGYCAVGTAVLTILTLILYHVIKNDWTFNKNIWKEILVSFILSAAVIATMSAIILLRDTDAKERASTDLVPEVEALSVEAGEAEETPQPVISSPESVKTSEDIISPDSKDVSDDEETPADVEDLTNEEDSDSEEATPTPEVETLTDVTFGDKPDETPTETPADVVLPTVTIDINSTSFAYHDFIGVDSILPESSTRNYDISELQGLSAKACVLARNEIYARHGRIFTNEDLMAYFSSKSWYNPTIPADQFSNAVLTKVEKYNKDLIVSFEKQMGYK